MKKIQQKKMSRRNNSQVPIRGKKGRFATNKQIKKLPIREKSGRFIKTILPYQGETILEKLQRCTTVKVPQSVRYPSGITALDQIFTSMGKSGLRPGIYLIVADPGAGKSSFVLQVMASMKDFGHLAVYAAFEGKENIIECAKRLRIEQEFMPSLMDQSDGVHPTSDSIISLMREIRKAQGPDSLPVIYGIDSIKYLDSTLGMTRGKREAMQKLLQVVQETQSIVFLIAHVTKQTRGKRVKMIEGPGEIEQLADVRLDFGRELVPIKGLRKTEERAIDQDGARYMTIDVPKNRFGLIGEFYEFKLGERGYEFPSVLFPKQQAEPIKK